MEHNEEYFSYYENDKNLCIQYARTLFYFRNIITGFEYLVPKTIPLIDLQISIVSLYFEYYSKIYENEGLEQKNIPKNIFINFKMLENIKLREILRKINFKNLKGGKNNSNEYNLFNLLINYSENIEVKTNLINKKNENLIVKIHPSEIKLVINQKYLSNQIEEIKKYLNLNNNSNYICTIEKDNYPENYLNFRFPKSLFNEENKSIGNLFWFFKIFAKDYLPNEFINFEPLTEFNDSIEYFLLTQNKKCEKNKSIWNHDLEKIIQDGYLLLDALKPMFKRQHNKEENKLIINKSSKLYITRKEEYLKREYTLEIIENIKKFFKDY